MFSKFLTLLGICLISFINVNAERGDIISYEYLDEITHENVVAQGMRISESLTAGNVILENLFEIYFSSLVEQRDMDVYKIVYETVDFYDNPVQASGALLIPKQENYNCVKSFSVYSHGTIFDREAVYSRPNNWSYEFFLPLLMSSVNTICAVPDYYGLGDGDGFHHHNSYKTNATSTIDMVRAGRKLCDILEEPYNNRLLSMGYSEGGTNSMGVVKMIAEEGLQDEFTLPFVGAGSGAYDLSGEAYEFIINNPVYPTRQYILYLLAGCEDIYDNLIDEAAGESISTYLKSPYDDLFTENVLGQNGNMSWVPTYWETMFQEEEIEKVKQNADHPFRVCLKNSNVYDWQNPNWTFMYYCTTDEQVPYNGALKTRDVQRSNIPWWRFWERFKIQALDITLGGTIPDHGTCALPSIFIQTLLMQQNLGLTCEFTGGKTVQDLQLKSTTGENFSNELIYSNKTINVEDVMKSNNLSSIKSVNLQTGKIVSSSESKIIDFTEDGFYLVQMQQKNGESLFSWLYKAKPDYVNTTDYDPILTNPMNQTTMIDLSLLQEEIQQIAVIDKNGFEHLVLTENLSDNKIKLDRTKSMSDGEYTVEVRTTKHTFPLLLKISSKELGSDFEIYPNPATDRLKVSLDHTNSDDVEIQIFNVYGALVLQNKVSNDNIELNIEDLPKGYYKMELEIGNKVMKSSFIKQ